MLTPYRGEETLGLAVLVYGKCQLEERLRRFEAERTELDDTQLPRGWVYWGGWVRVKGLWYEGWGVELG